MHEEKKSIWKNQIGACFSQDSLGEAEVLKRTSFLLVHKKIRQIKLVIPAYTKSKELLSMNIVN